MTPPHPALLDVAAGQSVVRVADEDRLLASAHEHRMVGALLAAGREGRLELSSATQTTLGVWDLGEQREHLRFWRTLGEVQEILWPLGVDVAVLKGIATEARWYDQLGERVTTDLDLLLQPEALDRVEAVIEALDPGYAPHAAAAWLVQRRMLPHVDLHVGATQVDLHFDPLRVGVPIRQLHRVWATTTELSTPWGTLRALSPEVELVLLLLHLNRDRFAYLGPFLDIARIITRGSLDWARVEAFVAAEGLEVPVWSSLAKVSATLELDVPSHLVSGLRAWSWARLWGPGHGLGGDAERAGANRPQRLMALHLRGRPADALAGVRRELVPQRQLLEVAGRIDPADPYLRHLARAVRGRVAGPRP